MALWGTNKDKGRGDQKPIWQQDKDPDGAKGRPAINEERNTYASNTGWVRRVVKTLPDGTQRVLEELLVSTNRVDEDGLADQIGALPATLGAANVTSVAFRDTSITANTLGYMDLSANINVDVSFNEVVDVHGSVQLQLSNSTVDFNVNAFPSSWDGVSSTAIGSQNNTNLLTFTVAIGEQTTGNGSLQITGTGLVFEDAITDNVGGATSNTTFTGNVSSILAGGGGNTFVLSVSNTIILGSANTVETDPLA